MTEQCLERKCTIVQRLSTSYALLSGTLKEIILMRCRFVMENIGGGEHWSKNQ